MEWIKTKHGLPPANKWVLCYSKDAALTNGYFIQSWMDATNHDSEWFRSVITHWTFLPDPPKP